MVHNYKEEPNYKKGHNYKEEHTYKKGDKVVLRLTGEVVEPTSKGRTKVKVSVGGEEVELYLLNEELTIKKGSELEERYSKKPNLEKHIEKMEQLITEIIELEDKVNSYTSTTMGTRRKELEKSSEVELLIRKDFLEESAMRI